MDHSIHWNKVKVLQQKSCRQKLAVSRNNIHTDHCSFLLGRAGLAHGEHASSNGHFSPQAAFRFPAAERSSRVHDENAIRRQTVDLPILLPLRRFLLQGTVQGYIHTLSTRMYAVSPFQNVYTEILTPHYAVR